MTAPLARNGAGLLLALTFLNVLNFADRYLLIGFSTDIVGELKLSNLEFGLLTGIVFTGIYTFMGLFTGSLADRVHRPRLIAAGLALWSGLTAATGIAANFMEMAAARLFIGVGESCLTPSAVSLLSDRFAPARRAFAGGTYYMGYPLGIGGALIFAGIVGPMVGWRGGFMLLGALGVACALLVLLLMRDPLREAGAAAAEAQSQSFGDTFRGMAHELRSNHALSLALASCALIVVAQGAGILDVLWWVKERGHAAVEAKRTLGGLFLFGGTLGAFLGGAGGDWAAKRWTAGRLKFLAGIYLLCVPAVTAYRLVPGDSFAFQSLAFLAAMSSLLLFGPALSALQELGPAKHRAAIVSLFVMVTSLIGAGGGNAMVGALADAFTKSGMQQPLTWAILLTQMPALLAIPGFWFAAKLQGRSNNAG